MKIALAGPTETSALRASLGLALAGAPSGTGQSPIAPLAAELRRMGHEVHVVTTDPTVDAPVTISEGAFSATFCPLRDGPRYRARTRALDLFAAEIRHLEVALKQLRPDVIHAHWTYEFAEAAVRTELPHLVTMHDLGWEVLRIFRDPYRLIRLVMKYRVVHRVRLLSVVSPFMAIKARQYGYRGCVEVVPNGVNLPPLDYALVGARDLLRPVIVTVGNDTRLKNVVASIAAFRLLSGKLPAARLHLFGPGLTAERLAPLPIGVAAHGVVPHSELMDFLHREATVLVHPSLHESFSVILAEAKAFALPVVGGVGSGGPPYVCGDGEGSRLVNVRDPSEIAMAIEDIIASPDRYLSAARASYADVVRRFGIADVARQYVALYERAANEQS